MRGEMDGDAAMPPQPLASKATATKVANRA